MTMETARWQRIKTLFQAAVDLRPEAREEYLAAHAGNEDSSLIGEVRSLLRAHDSASDFIEDPAVQSVTTAADAGGTSDEGSEDWTGRRVGVYEITEKVASGGMGTVYAGKRADDAYDKKVAIKLIRGGTGWRDFLQQTELRRRFRIERQALANLDHPNIARLLDGGTTDNGTPYLVMDYINGTPIDSYCDGRNLRTVDRLELFRSVCGAVHYAHLNLTIHRDLKPSNIMVTEDGTTILLDFGIAKLLDPTSPEYAEDQTRSGSRFFTPEYACPELLRGETVTTASDVYSLGVVLYRLLTGHRPYRLEQCADHEAARIVCEEEPARPSTAVTRTEEILADDGTTRRTLTPECVSRTRDGNPERLRRQLSGDIDAIVMKALRKEPEHRYSSVEQFSEDIRRHLHGLPVLAQKDTFHYRTIKFIRRHRTGMMAGVLVMFSILAGTAGVGWQIRIARAERDTANEQRQRAEMAEEQASADAATAKKVAQYLTEFFQVSDPFNVQEDASGVVPAASRDILDVAARRTQVELTDEPAIQATLLDTIGRIYQNLAAIDTADTLISQALELRRGALGNDHPDTASSLVSLANLHLQMDNTDEAEGLLDEALQIRERHFGSNSEQVAEVLQSQALLERTRGNYAEAEKIQQQAVGIFTATLDQGDPKIATAIAHLSDILQNLGSYAQAETLQRQALATLQDRYGDSHPFVADGMCALADIVMGPNGGYEEAELLLIKALEIYRATLGDQHPRVAEALHSYAMWAWSKGDHQVAKKLMLEALALLREVYPEDHATTLSCMNELALAYKSEGSYETAKSLYLEVLDAHRRVHGADHPKVADVLNNLAVLLFNMGKSEEAILRFEQALNIQQLRLGRDHPSALNTLDNLGAIHLRLGNFVEAEQRFLEEMEIERVAHGQDSHEFARTLTRLAPVHFEQGDYAKAASLLQDALALFQKTLPEGHRRIGYTLVMLGEVSLAVDDAESAERFMQEGVSIARASLPEKHPHIARCLLGYGEALLAVGKPEQADPILQEALEIFQERWPLNHPETGKAQSLLGECRFLNDERNQIEAEQLLLDGYETIRADRGNTHRDTRKAALRLVAFFETSGRPDDAKLYRPATTTQNDATETVNDTR